MCVIRGAKWIYKKFFPERENKPLISKDKFLVLRSDGSWILGDVKKSKAPAPIPPAPAAHTWQSYAPCDPVEDVIVDKPPVLFPFAKELELKLTDCIVAGAISSVTHTKTKDETYLLTIEIPFSENKALESTQLGLFIRVMSDKYKLVLHKQRKHISTVSSCKHHILTFLYDPRNELFKK